ncbi:MAG: hypothetical protein PHQ27_11300, partial [Victivallales bacterium]|nr:hypothetical protein [Victivallales bacterium]
MKLGSMGVLLGCLSGILWPTFGTAGENNPVAASPQSKYRAGFEKLFQLGLPRIPAGYRPALVYVPGYASPDFCPISWIKENPSEHVVDCFLWGLIKCRVFRPNHGGETAKKIASLSSLRQTVDLPLPFYNGMLWGYWELLDTDEVSEKIAELGEKQSQRNYRNDPDFESMLLIQAAQLYATGAEPAADALAARVLTGHDSRMVLTAALNLMACGRYEEIFMDFLRDGDWRRYGDGLDKMLAQYGRYWSNAVSGKILQGLLHDRIAGRVAPLPTRPFPLTPPDQEAARQLVGLDESGLEAWWQAGAGIWLLTPPERLPAENPVSTITSRGIAALPLLIDMLNDTVLLPLPRGEGNAYYNDDSDKVVGRIDTNRERKKIKAPLTRGELAAILLQMVIVPENNDMDMTWNTVDVGKMAEQARAFYREAKELNPDQLRKLYLKRGTAEQKKAVLQQLGHNIDDATAAMVEDILSDDDFIRRCPQLIRHYLAVRPDRAPAFIARLRQKMVSGREEYFRGVMSSKMPEDRKKRFIAVVKNRSELKFKLITGTMKKMTPQAFFRQVLANEEPGTYDLLAEAVDLRNAAAFFRQGVAAVAAAKNLEQKHLILNLIGYGISNSKPDNDGKESNNDKKTSGPDHALDFEQCRILLVQL